MKYSFTRLSESMNSHMASRAMGLRAKRFSHARYRWSSLHAVMPSMTLSERYGGVLSTTTPSEIEDLLLSPSQFTARTTV